jgi:EAL domain-containing protein (putative c-di-GMP-specific phosphodiesterase class I)
MTPGSANITEPMPDCTVDIASSFVVQAHDLRAPAQRHRRYPQRESFSTAAGLHRRPWFERLRRALEEDLFVLHYQPIVSLRQGRISGGAVSHYEALIRLADEPGDALTAPADFLPAAERYGLIAEIDRVVIAKVIAVLGGELADRQARIAVNLSALSITDRGMLAFIEGQLSRHRVDPERLIVELTETSAISDMALAQAFCEGVHRIGAAVALDDFGAGFGSFQYLKLLPFRYLKIDGDFIRALPVSRKDQLLVQALAGVARGMGRQTIAEYVGDEPTLALLREYGVDYAQGFEVGRPCGQPEAFALAA